MTKIAWRRELSFKNDVCTRAS